MQALRRMCLQRNAFLAQRQVVLQMQQRVRASQAGKRERQQFLATVEAAIVLQSAVRGMLVRRQLATEAAAATAVQAAWRCHVQRQR